MTEQEGKITQRRLVDAGKLGLYRQATLAMPIESKANIRVLARQGRLYSHTTVDMQLSGESYTYMGLVPAGKFYVELSSRTPIPTGFWEMFDNPLKD